MKTNVGKTGHDDWEYARRPRQNNKSLWAEGAG